MFFSLIAGSLEIYVLIIFDKLDKSSCGLVTEKCEQKLKILGNSQKYKIKWRLIKAYFAKFYTNTFERIHRI